MSDTENRMKTAIVCVPLELLKKFLSKCSERETGIVNGLIEALRDWIDKE